MARTAPSGIEISRYSSSVPRPRKLWLISVGLSCLLNLILVVVVLVRPTPQFSTSVLFQLRTAEAASLTRRWLPSALNEYPASEASITPAPRLAGLKRRSDYWISAGWNVECKVSTDEYLCRVWDPQAGTWSTQGPVTIQDTTTMTSSTSGTATTITSYDTETTTTSATPSTSERTTPVSTTVTSTSSTTAATPSPSINTNDTITGVFVGLWIGPMGACLEKRGAFRICSSPSFSPDNSKIYAQSGLDPSVIQLLPTGTAGGTVMLLFSLMAYCVAVTVFTVAYNPATRARTREGNRSYSNARYIWLLAIATLANAVGVVAVLISLIIFSRVFKNALDRIPELPFELFAEGGGGSAPLAVSCVFGIISTATGIFIVIDDLKLVLREAAAARSRRDEKAEKREKKRASRHRRSRRSRRNTRSHVDNDAAQAEEQNPVATQDVIPDPYARFDPRAFAQPAIAPDFMSARRDDFDQGLPRENESLPFWMQSGPTGNQQSRYARRMSVSASHSLGSRLISKVRFWQ